MPNRIIKESICSSDSIDGLSWFEEVFFYRLIVNCDDYGRMDARPPILRARLFPLKTVTDKQVEAALQSLRTAAMIDLYVVDGRSFLQLRTWENHQTIRAKKSKFPSPDDGLIERENICKQMISDESRCSRNPIQSNPNPNTNARGALDVVFDLFWTAYPKKVGKEAARKAMAKVKAPIETILTAIERQKRSEQWTKDNGQFIPNPATWLNQGRWEDELPQNPRERGEYEDAI